MRLQLRELLIVDEVLGRLWRLLLTLRRAWTFRLTLLTPRLAIRLLWLTRTNSRRSSWSTRCWSFRLLDVVVRSQSRFDA